MFNKIKEFFNNVKEVLTTTPVNNKLYLNPNDMGGYDIPIEHECENVFYAMDAMREFVREGAYTRLHLENYRTSHVTNNRFDDWFALSDDEWLTKDVEQLLKSYIKLYKHFLKRYDLLQKSDTKHAMVNALNAKWLIREGLRTTIHISKHASKRKKKLPLVIDTRTILAKGFTETPLAMAS